jgi:aminoglycoside phosphotransferase (APT) family kinase protein
MAPLPVLVRGFNDIAFYYRKKKCFGEIICNFIDPNVVVYSTFEQCRAAMVEARTEALHETREHARKLAASIEHVRTIPTAPFPDVSREVPEAQQQQQEAERQEKAPAKEVAPKPLLKRPSRKTQ